MMRQAINLLRHANRHKGRVVRAIAADSRRGLFAMVDQGVVSIGNFGLNIVLARHFAQHQQLREYGAFAVLMELMLFFNGVQSALLIYPLTIRGAATGAGALGRMTTQSLSLTLLCAPLMVAAMLVPTLLASHITLQVGLWAGIALVCWQLQETTRRALMARLRFGAACIGDTISYTGQFAAVALLARADLLSLETTFQAIAITSIVACSIQGLQIRLRRSSPGTIIPFGRDCWRVGRWVLFGNLTNVFTGALFTWNFAYFAGMDMLGVYQAVYNLIRPAHPLAFAVGTLVTPSAAKALARDGLDRARVVALRFIVLGGLLLAPYLLLLVLFPGLSLKLFYGTDSPYLQYPLMVQVAAVAVAMVYLGVTAGTFLNGVERTRQSFIGQAVYAGGFVFLVMPMTALYGLAGAMWSWLAASALRALVNIYYSAANIDDAAGPNDVGALADDVEIEPQPSSFDSASTF